MLTDKQKQELYVHLILDAFKWLDKGVDPQTVKDFFSHTIWSIIKKDEIEEFLKEKNEKENK